MTDESYELAKLRHEVTAGLADLAELRQEVGGLGDAIAAIAKHLELADHPDPPVPNRWDLAIP